MDTKENIRQELGRMVMFEPFFATLALSMKIEVSEDPNLTAGVNGLRMRFGAEFWDKLNRKQKRTLIVHEVMHKALMHDLRIPQLAKDSPEIFKVWNQACDWAINQNLTDEKWEFPEGGLTDPQMFKKFEGMSAETIFKILMDEREEEHPNGALEPEGDEDEESGTEESEDDEDEESYDDLVGGDTPDQDESEDGEENGAGEGEEEGEGEGEGEGEEEGEGNGAGDGSGEKQEWGEVEMNPAVDADEEDETEAERLQQIQEAVDAGERAGKLPSKFKKEFAELQKPKVDWRDLVGRWMEGRSTSDWSLSRPKQTGSIMMPRLDSETFGKIALVLDSSGSVDEEQMAQAITELFGALEVYEDEGMEQTITTMFTDTVVHGCFELSDPSDLVQPEGGGGTDFKEAFKAIDALEDQPLGAVMITDGWVDISKEEAPSCDVVWIVTEGYSSRAFAPPFGEVIFMNAL